MSGPLCCTPGISPQMKSSQFAQAKCDSACPPPATSPATVADFQFDPTKVNGHDPLMGRNLDFRA